MESSREKAIKQHNAGLMDGKRSVSLPQNESQKAALAYFYANVHHSSAFSSYGEKRKLSLYYITACHSAKHKPALYFCVCKPTKKLF